MVQITRRGFIASLTAALVMPRLALPAPAPGMHNEVADELVAFHEFTDTSVVFVRVRTVLVGRFAREMLARDPRMWSAVMVQRRLT